MTSTEQKSQEVENALNTWLDRPDAERFHFTEPMASMQQQLGENMIQKSIMVDLKSVHNWYGNRFVKEGLERQDTSLREPFFAWGYYTARIAGIFARAYPANPPRLSFTDLAMIFSTCLQAKWYDKSKEIFHSIILGLDTKYLNKGLAFSTSSWFILDLANSCYATGINLSRFNYPKNMGIYQDVLDNWNTTDVKEVDRLVAALSDHHLDIAGFNEQTPNDFSFEKEFVFAYEITAWLSLRKLMGLENPETFFHPLMQLVINKAPGEEILFTANETCERVLQKLKEEFPE